jgi:hypothetical protein
MKRNLDINNTGKIICKELEVTTFRNWHSVTHQRDNKTLDDKNNDEETSQGHTLMA